MDISGFLRMADLAAFAAALLFSLRGKRGAAHLAALVGVLGSLAAWVVLVSEAHRLPMFGMHETTTSVVLFVGLGALILERFGNLSMGFRPWFVAVFTLVLAYVVPPVVSHDFFMYSYFYAIVFFQSRLVVMGLLCLAGCLYWAAVPASRPAPERARLARMGRNMLLLGGICFLIGEFCGCIWALNGWGDSWHWSRGFFQSSAMFLAIMAGCHLPQHWGASVSARAAGGLISCLLFLTVYGVNQVMEFLR